MSLEINKGAWFDKAAVIADAGKRVASAYAQFGRFVTRTAARSMRKAGKKKGNKSEPGEPPRYHARKLLRDHIYFDWDSKSRSMVMGPAKLTTKSGISGVPRVLEEGGSTLAPCGTPHIVYRRKKGQKKAKQRTIYLDVHLKRVRITKRPYMGPAVKKSKSAFKWPLGVNPPAISSRWRIFAALRSRAAA